MFTKMKYEHFLALLNEFIQIRTLGWFFALLLAANNASAIEYPIGKTEYRQGMNITAVYLQPVEMEPEGHMLPVAESDIHLEADIFAAADNLNGFREGDWIPYLVVKFRLQKKGGKLIEGELMPMVANDGPHYGDNIKLDGPGVYTLEYEIFPPTYNEHSHFGRHTDRLTGVKAWFRPITMKYEFVYAGIGKKGGY